MSPRLRSLISSLAALLVFAPAVAGAAPWEGRRVLHDGADPDRALPLYTVPGAFSVTRGDGPAPAELVLGDLRLEHVGPLGAERLRTDRYRLGGTEADPGDVARRLARLPGVVVAAPLFRLAPVDIAAWRAVTPKVLLQLTDPFDESSMRDLADDLGLIVDRPRGLAPDQWRLLVPAGADVDPVEAAMTLHAAPWTRWAAVSWIQPHEERFVPEDELFVDQWHLDNTGQQGGTAGHDINAIDAWDLELGSSEAIVAILDSGVDTDHPDLAEHIVPGYDFINNDDDPNPGGSSHGTSCAGLAAAPAQGIGVVGTCPDCLIMPVRMLGADDETEADALDFAVAGGAWVVNNSWGPTDGTGVETPISAPMATAVDYAVEFGRDGKGTVVFWAAGNGHPVDTCDLDGFVAYDKTVAVGSSSNLGIRSSYSELCPQLDINAPSSGGSNGTASLTTTNIDGYTTSFGGTSAAAPVATGVGALVLSAVPELGWQDLRQLLRDSAEKIDTDGGDYDASGHSLSYGWGRINAVGALEAEVAFLTVPATVATCEQSLSVTVAIPTTPGLGSVIVEARSETETVGEEFLLTETDPGLYTGSIPLTSAPATADDGAISVVDGDVVTIFSLDVDDTAEVALDCRAPLISNPRAEQIQHWGAQLVWDTDEDADGHAAWGEGEEDQAEDPEFEGTHHIWALQLEPCTYYVATLRSADPNGNSTTAVDALGWTTPGDFATLPDDAAEGADPCDPDTWYPEQSDDDDTDDDDDTTGTMTGEGDCACDSTGGGPGASMLALGWVALIRRRRRAS